MMNNDFDVAMMFKAISLAKKSARNTEVPVGAIITKGNQIISCGENRREVGKNALYHAELEAIYNACKRLDSWRLLDCSLYVTLEPCPMCAGAIINARIKNLFFGAYDLKSGACGSVIDMFDKGFNHKPLVYGGLLSDECAEELSSFFVGLRKRNKRIKSVLQEDIQGTDKC